MKTITMDFETYEKELENSNNRGSRAALLDMLRLLHGEDKLQNVFYTNESSGWRAIDIKDTAQKILDLFDAQKEKN